MKSDGEDTNAHELVLIRRRSGGDDAPHKGGVWKIAYADFMTAMMAFFLVMWLINSTDQRVLTQVANYFNPMRLTDSTPQQRGLNNIESGEQGKPGKQTSVGDPKDKHQAKEKAENKNPPQSPSLKSEADADANAGAAARFTEQALFNDPYGVLARIAAEAPSEASAREPSIAGSDAYRDPFDPAARHPVPDKRAQVRDKRTQVKHAAQGQEAVAPQQDGKAKKPDDSQPVPEVAHGPESVKLPPAAGGEPKTPADSASATREKTSHAETAKTDIAAIQEALQLAKQAAEKAARDEATKIENEIKRVARELRGTIPNIDVTVTEDGVLISLTDDYDFGMFAIASAEPRPAMVVIMEKIASIVQRYPQPLTVRGHTDGRPYRSATYDNWRLSTARAHMAYYMLVRGGVDESRFERVEGYADRKLRVPSDPEAAQNRRIEILLRRPRP